MKVAVTDARSAAAPGVEVRPITGRADLARFIDLPWRVYADDPCWVPPLRMQVRDAPKAVFSETLRADGRFVHKSYVAK